MKLRQLRSWRFSLIFSHRWLGIVIALMFVIWSISGVVLLYTGIPHINAGERLSRLADLDLSAVTITPAEAASRYTEGEPFRLRISMHGDRPVYRINTGFVFGRWTIIYADTGELMSGLDSQAAMNWLASSYPEYADTLSYETYLEGPDTFTHSPLLQTHMPMHRIAMGDAANSKYYVSQYSGETVMKTTRISRILGFMGYNLHTMFFFRQQSWWTSFLHWITWLGLGLASLGMVLGIWRFSKSPRYMQRGVKYRTPYTGWWKWHHYAGVIFGTLMITWLFSGLVSMSEIPGISETLYTPSQIQAGARSVQGQGAYVDLSPLTIKGLQHASNTISNEFPIKELELLVFNGETYYFAYRSPTPDEVENWNSRSAFDFITPTLEQQQLMISATDVNAQPFSQFTEEALLNAAKLAMPDANITARSWLDDYDSYYYNTLSSFDLGLPKAARLLPVLQVKFDDPNATWLYLTPGNAQILKAERLDRRNRWGYYGLHGFDFDFLFNNRPIWDIVILIFLAGVMTLSTTTLVPAFIRLKRHTQRFFRNLKTK